MAALVKSLEDLRVSLREENKLLKERDLEKNNIIAKMSQDQNDNEKVLENLRELVEKGEQEAFELKKQAKIKDEMLAKAVEEIKKVEII